MESRKTVLKNLQGSNRETGFPGGSEVKVSACSAGDLGSIPGSGRCPGEGNGNPLQYSRLENPMEGGAWWATVTGLLRVGHHWATNTFTFSGETDIENRLMDMGRGEERVRCMERATWKLTLPYVK